MVTYCTFPLYVMRWCFLRGLGMERLFFNHMLMYSDQKLLVIVLNTTPQDEVSG